MCQDAHERKDSDDYGDSRIASGGDEVHRSDDRARPCQDRDGERRDRNVFVKGCFLQVFYRGFLGLEHLESHKENQDPAGDLESRNRNTEEFEDKFAEYDKQKNYQKGDGSGFSADFSLGLLIRIFYHGGEDRHVCDRIHDRKKSRKNGKCKSEEFVFQELKALESEVLN